MQNGTLHNTQDSSCCLLAALKNAPELTSPLVCEANWPFFDHNTLELYKFSTLTYASQVISYEGEILFQGRDEKVIITLLKVEIPDSSLETYTYRQFRLCSISHQRKGKGFKASSQQTANAKVSVWQEG